MGLLASLKGDGVYLFLKITLAASKLLRLNCHSWLGKEANTIIYLTSLPEPLQTSSWKMDAVRSFFEACSSSRDLRPSSPRSL